MMATFHPARLAVLFTGQKSFSDPLLIGHPRLNAWGLHTARVRLAYAVNRRRRRRLASALDPADREAFDRDGYVVIPSFLSADAFQELSAQVERLQVDTYERHEGGTLLRDIPINQRVLRTAPALRALLDNPRYRALLAYGEGNRARPLFGIQTVLQNDLPSGRDPQCTLHRDTFHPTVKAWLYLTDVPEAAGPFVYVPGSHRLTPERLAWEKAASLRSIAGNKGGSFRITRAELSAMQCQAPRALPVAANTLIVADTFGFHARGVAAGPSLRREVRAMGMRAPFLSAWAELLVSALAGRRRRRIWSLRRARSGQHAPEPVAKRSAVRAVDLVF